jgi:hypothetical protein
MASSRRIAALYSADVAEFRFELSLPIDQAATDPFVRQCFIALCSMAAAQSAYTKAAEFDPLLVQTSSMYDRAEANTAMKLRCSGLQATQPYSPRTRRPSSVGPLSDTGLGFRSILFGD